MKKLVSQYINREIKDEESLAKLRDDSEFMLEVFETKMKAVEFDNVSDRLKDDEKFIQRCKDIFSHDSDEFFSLCISLRNYRKKKALREEKVSNNDTKKVEQKKVKKLEPQKSEKIKSVPVKVKSSKVASKSQVSEKIDKKMQDDSLDYFNYLVSQLAITEEERETLISKYREASDDKRILAVLMIMDYLYIQGSDKPVQLLKSSKNNFYPHF